MISSDHKIITPPGIGLHREIPADVYHKWDLCSNSRLSVLANSCPAKLKYQLDNPESPTPAMLIGSAVHCLTLEGSDRFGEMFAVAPECDRRTKEGKATWERFVATAGNRTVLRNDDYLLASRVAHSVRTNAHAAAALAAAPEREVSAVWTDGGPGTGLMCKARFDALGAERGLIVDLKTTENAGREFERSIDAYGIARQAAFYIHGAAALNIPIADFLVIAVEKEPPYLVGLHRITDEAIELAWRECRPLIEQYWQAATTDIWPGYEDRDSGLPAWAVKRIEATAGAK